MAKLNQFNLLIIHDLRETPASFASSVELGPKSRSSGQLEAANEVQLRTHFLGSSEQNGHVHCSNGLPFYDKRQFGQSSCVPVG
jgi:hypothetical protein